ncbi:alkaline phosphatase [Bacillus sp. B15-48]|nr:alkaline phosphatase [Bacillus sp. B15-48]MBM4760930.1 alkaline phosphatase [Bacillus sp. B15-48]
MKNKKKIIKTAKRPKNVIMMIGDGMGIGQIEMARLFEYGKKGRLFMETLPYVALAHTYSANNIVTDSAAGGTAIATGQKTNNEMIGITPDGKAVDSILDKFKQDGKRVGIVSTSTVTDATPAAFTANVSNRWAGQTEVARQQLKNDIDVILGGGRSYFEKEKQNGVDLIAEFQEEGYTYVTNKKELKEAGGEKLLGLFHPTYMNFMIDRDELRSEEPTLQEMTAKALEVLSQDAGFFLMVEGARIDHAAHSADLTSVWKEIIEFDNTVKDVTDWAEKHGDTLIVVLADHETMGISATEPVDIERLKRQQVSPEYMARQLVKAEKPNGYTSDSIRNVFKSYADMDLSNEEITQFNEAVTVAGGKIYAHQQVGWEIGSIIAAHHHAGIVRSPTRAKSSTGGHTGNLVPVFAFGDGAENFEGVLDNIDIPNIIAELMDYEL